MATTRRTLPDFLTNATLGALVAAGLEEMAEPDGETEDVRDHEGNLVRSERITPPAPSRTERARRAMYASAAGQIRAHHQAEDGSPS